MRVNFSITDKNREKDFHFEKYMCPFCVTSIGTPGELTIAVEKSTLRVAWTECTRGYANCCAIAELHAKLIISEPH